MWQSKRHLAGKRVQPLQDSFGAQHGGWDVKRMGSISVPINLKQLVPPGLDADLTRNDHGCSYYCRGYRVALKQVFKVSSLNFASRFILE